jgi:hypothetical protein
MRMPGKIPPGMLATVMRPCWVVPATTQPGEPNMTEEEAYRLDPRLLAKRLDSLEFAIRLIMGTLTEEQREYILRRLAESSRMLQEEAQRKDTDTARDAQIAMYEIQEALEEASRHEAEIYADRQELYGIT